jgi:hypothetical protein
VDREELARAGRRRQALAALEFERSRAEALRDRLEQLATELDGPAVDAAVFAAMRPEEVEIVRPELQPAEPEPLELEEFDEGDGPAEENSPLESASAFHEAEIERLRRELSASAERERAFASYVRLLGDGRRD